ncbi:double-strand break repair helicase AddA [Iodidimonas nitroreducens]|uniref:DNA 3'-5' helicase n=1 Tax=Iodidimonas nitroreducens TaxID=1236968 RepID=A0A5A7NAF7_9PROT|nr:double-strand break repair helicase AddA [Iodidimonas nitroreducens]GER05361.1 double-strand break repair helicase AddA [Iodidimonas nitroreducens]
MPPPRRSPSRPLLNTGEGLTAVQDAASNPRSSIWVMASAGTGKTHVLTARVLRLLLRGVRPEQILCLTFTKAAAAEMANRLRKTLGTWARLHDDQVLAAEINLKSGERADAAMLKRARQLFAHVLDLSEGLRIQTIHAFCQALLGRFPLEAGLSPHFDLIEDQGARDLLAKAREDVINHSRHLAKNDQKLADAISRIASEVNEEGFDALINTLIHERRILHDLLQAYGMEGLITAIRRRLGVHEGETAESLLSDALSDDALPLDDLRHFLSLLHEKGGVKDKQHIPALESIIATPASERAAHWDAYGLVFLTGKGEPRKTSVYPVKAVKTAWPEVVDFIANEAARLLAIDDRRKLIQVSQFAEAALRVGAAILSNYEAAKTREGVLDYNDLIAATEKLLKRDDIAPWILYKLDAEITHVLVDEAQDTNPEQWSVINALTDDFFSGQSAYEPKPVSDQPPLDRTLFAVGDLKQSIYGFQGADPRAFITARDRVHDKAEAAHKNFGQIDLDQSFRSVQAVLSLVDAVFDDPTLTEGISLEERAIRHQAHRAGHGGLVELWPIEPQSEKIVDDAWDVPDQQQPDDNVQARLAVRIARHIRALLDSGEQLSARGRAIRPGDILILMQTRSPFVDFLIKKLKQLHVPVAGSDRMTITDQIAVRDMLAAAHLALLPEDDLCLATVLKGPLIALDEAALFDLAHDRGQQSLWDRLREKAPDHPIFTPALKQIEAILARADLMPPYEFFARLAGPLGMRRALIGRMGAEVLDPLDELLRLARDYETNQPPSLQGFLQWIERGGAEIKRDPEQKGRNEVRIMTVHGAKGLQAPIVYLPDCNRLPPLYQSLLKLSPAAPSGRPDLPLLIWRGNSKSLEVGPLKQARDALTAITEQEYWRLLYVALTRAEDRLYACAWETRAQTAVQSWYERIKSGMERLKDVEHITNPEDERIILRFSGEQTCPPKAEEQALEPDGPIDRPAWLDQPPMAEPIPSRPLSPSRPTDEEPAALSPLEAGQSHRWQRGLLIHKLLELLPEIAPKDREAAARRFLAQPAYALDPKTIDQWWAEIAAILDAEDFSALFAPGSLAEVSLAGLVGDRAISGQIDRLAVSDQEVFIIDYKTNRPPPLRVEDTSPAYLRQMRAYRDALRRIYRDKPIRCALLWTDGPRLMDLPDDLLDRQKLTG